jgi:hypothetical protein
MAQVSEEERSLNDCAIVGLIMDKELWHDAMPIANRSQVPPPEGWSRLDSQMRDLLHCGLYDAQADDVPWPSST